MDAKVRFPTLLQILYPSMLLVRALLRELDVGLPSARLALLLRVKMEQAIINCPSHVMICGGVTLKIGTMRTIGASIIANIFLLE